LRDGFRKVTQTAAHQADMFTQGVKLVAEG
jgi:hypothetical protein